MRKLFLVLLPVIIASAGLLSSCQSTSKTSGAKMLKFNLEEGKGYDYEMIWDLNTTAGGQEVEVSMTALYSMDVTGVEGNLRTISTAYKKINMFMKVMGMEMEFGSDKTVAPDSLSNNPMGMMNKMLSGLTGKKFTIKVDDEGKVLEVNGFEKLLNDMVDSMDIDAQSKAQALASLKDQFSEQSIKDQFGQVLTIFPVKEIKVGDSWVKELTMGGKLPGKYSTTYTVKEIDGDHVTLNADTKISSAQQGQQISGTQSGKILVDSKTGLTINANFDQEFEVEGGEQSVKVKGKGRIRGTQR